MKTTTTKSPPRRSRKNKAATVVPTTLAGIVQFYNLVGLPAPSTMPFGMSAEEFGRRVGEQFGYYDGSHTVLKADAEV